jgi:hypothetical protein
MVLQGMGKKNMAELKFPVTELDKDKFQVVVDMNLQFGHIRDLIVE